MNTLTINLPSNDELTEQKIKAITKKVKEAGYQPTFSEIWDTGYLTATGKQKLGILQSKMTPTDEKKLRQVREAVASGELPNGVEDMKKFTKAHALRLYTILAESRKGETIRKMIEEIPENYHLINTIPEFERLLMHMSFEAEMAIDTETTGLDYADRICGISITLPRADYHVYIPVRHTEGLQLSPEYVFSSLKPFLESEKYKWIFFNAKFDVHMFIKEGIRVKNIFFDGYVAMKLLSEAEHSYSLKNLSTKYGKHFGFEDRSATYEELFGRGGFQDTPFHYKGGPGIGTVYACKDTHLTYKFYKDFIMVHFDRLPKLKDLYFNIEQPITKICVDMEQNGLLIDLEYSKEYADMLRGEIDGLEYQLNKDFEGVNLNSPAQLSTYLYDVLDLPNVSKKRSTDAKTLKILAKHHSGIKNLLKYRELTKLLSTYIEPLPQLIWPRDQRLHGSFNQVLAETGRFSSSGPNLQNLPAEARKMVVPAAGKIIVGSDYSQIEPRILGHLTGDPSLIAAYTEDKDLYIEMAVKVFKLERKFCVDKAYDPTNTFQPRKAVKAVLLGIMYGMGSKSLAENVGVSVAQADQIIADFFDEYPAVRTWIDESIKFAEENEYIETMFGRKRRFPGFRQIAAEYHSVVNEIKDRIGELPKNIWAAELPYMVKQRYWNVAGKYNAVCRKVVNTRIQGSAADIMKLAMVSSDTVVKTYKWQMIATIHDEILFEVPEDVTLEQINELEAAMLNVVSLSLPMKVDTAFMPQRWGVEIGKSEWFGGAN